MSYDQPDHGAKFTPRDHPEWLGKLFLIFPESVETVNFNRPDGSLDPTDMVTADVAIIDLPDPQNQGKPTVLVGARIGGSALVPQLKKKIGKKVLGRLNQTPAQGQKSGAYFLADFSPQDVQTAEQYEAAFPRQQYDSGSGNQPPPAQQWQAGPPAQSGPPAPQSQFPSQSWGGAQPAAAPPATAAPAAWGAPSAAPAAAPPAWGAAAAAPPPAAPAAPPWPDGLREFLTSRGINTEGMDEAQARQIAATLQ